MISTYRETSGSGGRITAFFQAETIYRQGSGGRIMAFFQAETIYRQGSGGRIMAFFQAETIYNRQAQEINRGICKSALVFKQVEQ